MKNCNKILVTGGCGYIGSHTIVELSQAGYDAVVVDNLSNSCAEALRRVERIVGKEIPFYEVDIRDEERMKDVFDQEGPFDCVIHFAAMKCVGESTQIPIAYYSNNLGGTFSLLKVMSAHNCKRIVFSSSCAVYGQAREFPIREDTPIVPPTNPYGWTKQMMEQVFRDVQKSDAEWDITMLRYFNPIGAHESGLIGEDPNGVPNNLLPYIAQVAVGRLKELHVYGNDYPTVDGSGVRDFIHVVDLARAHVKAVDKMLAERDAGLKLYNLGTGKGFSVLQVLRAFEKISGRTIPYVIEPRRPGDVAECWADPSLANRELGWKAEYGIEKMCSDLWNWQTKNPYGFAPCRS